MLFHRLDGVGNCDFRQRIALIEHILAYQLYTVGENHLGQVFAVVENFCAEFDVARNVAEVHFEKPRILLERFGPHLCHRCGNGNHAVHARIVDGHGIQICHSAFGFAVKHAVVGIETGVVGSDVYFFQRIAVAEHIHVKFAAAFGIAQ